MKDIKDNIYLNNENLTLLLTTVVKDQMNIIEKNYMKKENNLNKIHIRWSSSEVWIFLNIGSNIKRTCK